MSITADFHMHSAFSGDAEVPMEAMIQKAIDLGLTHMCFTEHNDFDFPISEEFPEGTFDLNVDAYLYDLLKYRDKYKDKINILFGIELGVQPQVMRPNSILARSYDFDFILGSSHLCNGKDPYYPEFYAGRSEEEAYGEYFESILTNIKKFTNFDVYAHLDYVVRYGPNKDANYTFAKYRDILDPVLRHLVENSKGLEINTGGVKYGLKELHPCTDILKRYRELGGEIITIGSDAHSPEIIANHFDRAADVLKECGFKYYTIFEKRVAEFKKL